MYHTDDPERFFSFTTCDGSPTGHSVSMGDITLVFSYTTVVAFAVSGYGWCVSENVWSKTTGKHINGLTPSTGTGDRLPREDYLRMLSALAEFMNGKVQNRTLVQHMHYAKQHLADLSTPPKVEEFLDA